MKKEVLLAILVGFSIGLIITFAIYQAQKQISDDLTLPEETVTVPSETSKVEEKVHLIDIVTPENFTLAATETITISGFTTKNSYITAVSDTQEVVTQANASGSFAFEFKLENGVNIVSITSLSDSGETSQKDVTVTYLETKTSNNQKEADTTDE